MFWIEVNGVRTAGVYHWSDLCTYLRFREATAKFEIIKIEYQEAIPDDVASFNEYPTLIT